jgi:tetratricopeptide (TPR) repeat protein
VLNVLGEVALAAGAGDEAEERWTEALSRYRALRDQRGQMLVLVSFGRLAHDLLRNYEEARRLWEEALVVADELGEVRAQRVLLTNLCMVARTLGDTDSARELTGRSAALSAQLGDPRGQLVAARTLAQISIEAQDWGGARQRLDEALRMADDLGDRPARVDLLRLSAAPSRCRTSRLRPSGTVRSWPSIAVTACGPSPSWSVYASWSSGSRLRRCCRRSLRTCCSTAAKRRSSGGWRTGPPTRRSTRRSPSSDSLTGDSS